MMISKEIKNLKASKSNERFWSNYKTMLFYCLKCRKSTEKKTREFWKSEKKENLYEMLQFVAVKNKDLLTSKKLVDH